MKPDPRQVIINDIISVVLIIVSILAAGSATYLLAYMLL